MKGLFKPDSGLMIVMTQITDCIFLSMFFLMGCVPVVTTGASFAALYDAAYRGFRQGEKNSWQRFLQVFKTNWKAGILPTILFYGVLIGAGYGMIQLWNGVVVGKVGWMLFAGAAFAAVVLVGMLSLLFPILSRFENSLAGLVVNTVVLSLAHLPRTVVLGIVNTLAALLCVLYVLPAFVLPALAALIGSLLIEPIFKPYMRQEEAAE